MSNMEQLLDNNRAFARTDAKSGVPQIPFLPNKQLYVITCIDPRVDPSDLLGLSLGDAIVARNVGGRVTSSVLQDLAWISYLHETKTPGAQWFEIAVIHHTDCGSALLADNELRNGFAQRGFDAAALAELPVVHPAETVRHDVGLLRRYPHLSQRIAVSGCSYDLTTGLLTEICSVAVGLDKPGARG